MYNSSVQWYTPLGKGSLDMKADRHSLSRSIEYSATLTLQPPLQNATTYKLRVDLDNKSTEDKVDVGLAVELTSSLDSWE